MTNQTNSWQEWNPRKRSSLEKYTNQLVVIVGKGKSRVVYLTDADMKILKNPKNVKVYTRGNNIAIAASDDTRDYSVQSHEKSRFPNLTINAVMKSYNLQPGVYICHIEGGMLIFDTLQTPSRP
jgi:hypothetical protein